MTVDWLSSRPHSLVVGDGGWVSDAWLVDFEQISRPWKASRRSRNRTPWDTATNLIPLAIWLTTESRAQFASVSYEGQPPTPARCATSISA